MERKWIVLCLVAEVLVTCYGLQTEMGGILEGPVVWPYIKPPYKVFTHLLIAEYQIRSVGALTEIQYNASASGLTVLFQIWEPMNSGDVVVDLSELENTAMYRLRHTHSHTARTTGVQVVRPLNWIVYPRDAMAFTCHSHCPILYRDALPMSTAVTGYDRLHDSIAEMSFEPRKTNLVFHLQMPFRDRFSILAKHDTDLSAANAVDNSGGSTGSTEGTQQNGGNTGGESGGNAAAIGTAEDEPFFKEAMYAFVALCFIIVVIGAIIIVVVRRHYRKERQAAKAKELTVTRDRMNRSLSVVTPRHQSIRVEQRPKGSAGRIAERRGTNTGFYMNPAFDEDEDDEIQSPSVFQSIIPPMEYRTEGGSQNKTPRMSQEHLGSSDSIPDFSLQKNSNSAATAF